MSVAALAPPAAAVAARFDHLTLVTWAVPDELLRPRLPPGVELDRWEGRACVSLVTLELRDLRVWGVPVPTLRRLPDVNLRFYVRQAGRPGVTFVRELVPHPAVVLAARTVWGEPFDLAAIESRVARRPDGGVEVERRIAYRGRHRVRVEAHGPPGPAAPGSDAAFFTDRPWGFARGRAGGRVAVECGHPPWAVYPVARWTVALDFGRVYGPEWAFLAAAAPVSVLLARGSWSTVSAPAGEA